MKFKPIDESRKEKQMETKIRTSNMNQACSKTSSEKVGGGTENA